MKKILALICSAVMIVSMFTITTNAAIDGVTATLEFKEYQTVGTTTFAVVDLKVTIPDTLSPFTATEPDYINTDMYTYSGTALQGLQFTIPYVDGLTFMKARSTTPIGATITANANAKTAEITVASTGEYSTWYAGEMTTIATLQYKVADPSATYNLALTNAVVKLYTFGGESDDGSVPVDAIEITEYTFGDFTVTNAVVKPAGPTLDVEDVKVAELTADTKNIEFGGKTYTNVAAWAYKFDLKAIQDEYVDTTKGESFIKAGFKSTAKGKWIAPELNGDGEVDAKLIFVGITDDEAKALDIDAYLQANLVQ